MERINSDRREPEPWLRGNIADVHSVIAQVLYSFQHAWEDLNHFTRELTQEQVWFRPMDLAPVGFHIRHIGGSIDRLLTYMRGDQLSDEQLRELKIEMNAGPARDDLLSVLRAQLDKAEHQIRRCDPATLPNPRKVGRKELPTTVGGLLVHMAEHTQRHVGQAIVTAKLVTSLRGYKQ
jgi:hypothetical protein